MMKLFLVLMMLTACWATPQDLSGKMFTFPEDPNLAFVKLSPPGDDFSNVTVCLRFFTDLSRNHALFSMATPKQQNAFLMFKMKAAGQLDLNVGNNPIFFNGFDYKLNTWNSICSTWESDTGLGQHWLNGNPSARKFIKTGNIVGKPIVMLGQEQDSYGGVFSTAQSFVGMISDVHMWNYVLSPCEIDSYSSDITPGLQSFPLGNEINWKALEYEASGKVLLENKQQNNGQCAY